jgi:hypothetical protein
MFVRHSYVIALSGDAVLSPYQRSDRARDPHPPICRNARIAGAHRVRISVPNEIGASPYNVVDNWSMGIIGDGIEIMKLVNMRVYKVRTMRLNNDLVLR